MLKICGTGEKNLSFQHSLHDLEVTKLKKYPYRHRLKLNMDAKVTSFLSKYEYVLLWPCCRALSEPEVDPRYTGHLWWSRSSRWFIPAQFCSHLNLVFGLFRPCFPPRACYHLEEKWLGCSKNIICWQCVGIGQLVKISREVKWVPGSVPAKSQQWLLNTKAPLPF